MKRTRELDMNKIALGLGAQREGTVRAGTGPFAAKRIAAEVAARFRAPPSGGRSTNPEWTEQRLVRLAPRTLRRLEALAAQISALGGEVAPLQVASLLLERATDELDIAEVAKMTRKRSA